MSVCVVTSASGVEMTASGGAVISRVSTSHADNGNADGAGATRGDDVDAVCGCGPDDGAGGTSGTDNAAGMSEVEVDWHKTRATGRAVSSRCKASCCSALTRSCACSWAS
jgi:hypothetical protein